MERLKQITLVLLHSSHGGNVGAAARAMKVMGMDQLRLVKPQNHLTAEATARASGADDVLHQAQVFDDINQAIGDCHLVLGTSSRHRDMNIPLIDMRQAAQLIVNRITNDSRCAILFGREKYGLTNQEVQRCHYLIQFPANPQYPSLNLAAAVQLAAYELRMAALQNSPPTAEQPKPTAAVDMQKMESFYQHLFTTLQQIEFIEPHNRQSLEKKLRMIFNRLQPEKYEMDILRGILSKIKQKTNAQT